MGIIAGLLAGLFSGLTDFFVKWFTKKVAIGVAAVTVFAGLTLALFGTISALFVGLISYLPADSALLVGLWVAFPPNLPAVMSALIAADTAIALYRWNVENLKLLSYIT